jgi:hypothetical protein
VLAEQLEDERLADRDECDRTGEHRLVALGDATGDVEEAELERERERRRGKHRVGDQLQRAALVDGVGNPRHHRLAHVGHPGECRAAHPAAPSSPQPSQRLLRTANLPRSAWLRYPQARPARWLCRSPG